MMNNKSIPESSIIEEMSAKADKSLIPLSVLIELTRHCNLQCKHCYRIEDKKRTEMSLATILDLIAGLHQSGCLFLAISGGEPLMHPSFLEICRRASSSNLALKIFTNGTLITTALSKKLASLNIIDISLSIYGASPATHDRITQKKGSYKKTINAALILKDSGLNVRFKYIMMQDNISDYKDMLALSKKMKIPYDIDPVITPCDNGDAAPTKLRLRDKDLEIFYRNILSTGKLSVPENRTRSDSVCSFGRSCCAINSYGDVYPCIQLPVPAGNIQNDAFREIWRNSKWLKEIRGFCTRKKPVCNNCELSIYCHRCPGMDYLETKSIYGISRETCRHARIIKKVLQNAEN
ncbi:MAG: radical SAM protein [Planctomycetota bacterium]